MGAACEDMLREIADLEEQADDLERLPPLSGDLCLVACEVIQTRALLEALRRF